MRLISALSLLLFSLPAWAAEIVVETRPSAVTVFPDRAMVTRTGQVKLPAGSHTLVFQGLPGILIAESLHATGSGLAEAVIGAVENREVPQEELAHTRERDVARRIAELKDQRSRREATVEALNVRQDFIKALSRSTANGLRVENSGGQIRTDQWEQAWTQLQAGSEQTLHEIVTQNIAMRGIDEQREKLEADLEAVRTDSKTVRLIRVQVDTTKDGTMEVALQYQLSEALWGAHYDARLFTETGKLTLAQFGVVRQQTGEDWTEVDLTLSTAKPAEASQMRMLEPRWVQTLATPKKDSDECRAALIETRAVAERLNRMQGRSLRTSGEPIEVVSSEFAAEYRIRGKMTVPADGAEHRFPITNRDFNAALSVRAVPKKEEKAYLYAEIKVEGEAPTLAGAASLYRDATYIGGARLASLKPGDTAELSFGVDERVTVDYQPQRGQSGEHGMFSKEQRTEHRSRTNVTNLHGLPIKIVIYDQMPVSKSEDLKITLLDRETTPGFAKDIQDKPGLLSWTWEAKPGERKSIDFGYVATYPPDKMAVGL